MVEANLELGDLEKRVLLALGTREARADSALLDNPEARETGMLSTPISALMRDLRFGSTEGNSLNQALEALASRGLLRGWTDEMHLDPSTRLWQKREALDGWKLANSLTLTERGHRQFTGLAEGAKQQASERRRRRVCPGCGSENLLRGYQATGLRVHVARDVEAGVRVFSNVCLDCGMVSFFVRKVETMNAVMKKGEKT